MTIKARLSKDVSAFKNMYKGGKEAINNTLNDIKENPSVYGAALCVGGVVGGLGLAVYGGMTNNAEAVKTGATIAMTSFGMILPVGFGASVLQDKLAASKARAD